MISTRLRTALPVLLAPVLLAAPRAAHACAVCTGGASEEVNQAFLTGSLFLSVLPLAAIGSAIWWVRRRARALALRSAGGVAAAQPPPRAGLSAAR